MKHMKQIKDRLIPGLHLAIVANFSGGCGGSMLALETYATCKSHGISALLATNDHSHVYQNLGSDLYRLPVITGEQGQDQMHHLDDIKQLIAEARAQNKFLIIDIKAGYASAHQMLSALRDSGAFESSTIAALLPVISGDHGVCGAAIALKTMEDMGIKVDSGFIRMWTLPGNATRPDISELPQFPIWSVAQLPQHARVMINGGYWNVKLAKIQLIFQCPDLDRRTLHKLIAHFETTEKAIYDAIIAPITRSDPGPIPYCIANLIPKPASSNLHLLAKTILHRVEAISKSANEKAQMIIVTMIAGKLKRWHHSGQWIPYSLKPGDILKVWNPQD